MEITFKQPLFQSPPRANEAPRVPSTQKKRPSPKSDKANSVIVLTQANLRIAGEKIRPTRQVQPLV
jgi:hypothetical protein